jgi:hypothetical protein
MCTFSFLAGVKKAKDQECKNHLQCFRHGDVCVKENHFPVDKVCALNL